MFRFRNKRCELKQSEFDEVFTGFENMVINGHKGRTGNTREALKQQLDSRWDSLTGFVFVGGGVGTLPLCTAFYR